MSVVSLTLFGLTISLSASSTAREPIHSLKINMATPGEEALATAGATGGDRNSEKEAPDKISRMRKKYNLEEGRVKCRCLIRKWKFCQHIKGLADGRVTPNLVETRSLKDVKNMSNQSDTCPDRNPDNTSNVLTILTPPDTPKAIMDSRPLKRKSRQDDKPKIDTFAPQDNVLDEIPDNVRIPVRNIPDKSKTKCEPRKEIIKRKRGRPLKSLSLKSTSAQKEMLDKFWIKQQFLLSGSNDV